MMRKTRKAPFAKLSSAPTKLAIALSTVVAAQALAEGYPNHQFGAYYRMDLQVNSTNPSDEDINGTVDQNEDGTNTKFTNNTLRLNFAGDLTDMTSYRFRFRPGRAADDTDIDGFNGAVDYAYLTHEVSDNFAVRGGKFFWLGHCGREGDYNGQDVYLFSSACDGPDYKTGFGLMPMFGGHTFVLSVVNGSDETEDNHANVGFGISWYGDFGGTVMPIAYYGTQPNTEQKNPTTGVTLATGEATTDTYMGGGVRVDFGLGFVEADYIDKTVEGRATNNATDEKTTSYAFAARARLMNGSLQPHVKYTIDQFDDDDSNDATTDSWDRQAYSVALEYYPEMYKENGVDWRVHLVYTNKDYTFDRDNKDDFTETQILFGFAFNFTNAGPKKMM